LAVNNEFSREKKTKKNHDKSRKSTTKERRSTTKKRRTRHESNGGIGNGRQAIDPSKPAAARAGNAPETAADSIPNKIRIFNPISGRFFHPV